MEKKTQTMILKCANMNSFPKASSQAWERTSQDLRTGAKPEILHEQVTSTEQLKRKRNKCALFKKPTN
jgi:hypothetical protein